MTTKEAPVTTKPSAAADSMAALVEEYGPAIIPFRQSDIVEVEVTGVSKQRILVNVQDLALGFIPQREFSTDSSMVEVGQKLLGYILSPENEDGYVVLSLKRADRERLWRTIAEQSTSNAVLSVKISDANKGGLVIDYGGIEGFLPISQLSSSQYARLAGHGGDLESKLRGLVGQMLRVKILSYDERARKLIFSEKAAGQPETSDRLKELAVGQKLDGTVTGVVDFGLFVEIGGIEGLVHISEVSWERVEDLRKLYKPGDKVAVEVIAVDDQRVSLSIKRLLVDPWLESVKKYEVGKRVEGTVTRITQFGAFVRLDPVIEGLVHVSEIIDRESEPQQTIEQILEAGKVYPFIILSIDPAAHRIALSHRSAKSTGSVAS